MSFIASRDRYDISSSMEERGEAPLSLSPGAAIQYAEFLRATASMLSAHMLSQIRNSVRLSVCLSLRHTGVIHAKTVEVRILQFSPYSSPVPLVFAR